LPEEQPPSNSPGYSLVTGAVTVITNALRVVDLLVDQPGIDLVALGGAVSVRVSKPCTVI